MSNTCKLRLHNVESFSIQNCLLNHKPTYFILLLSANIVICVKKPAVWISIHGKLRFCIKKTGLVVGTHLSITIMPFLMTEVLRNQNNELGRKKKEEKILGPETKSTIFHWLNLQNWRIITMVGSDINKICVYIRNKSILIIK